MREFSSKKGSKGKEYKEAGVECSDQGSSRSYAELRSKRRIATTAYKHMSRNRQPSRQQVTGLADHEDLDYGRYRQHSRGGCMDAPGRKTTLTPIFLPSNGHLAPSSVHL
jgi:hypothetical protein